MVLPLVWGNALHGGYLTWVTHLAGTQQTPIVTREIILILIKLEMWSDRQKEEVRDSASCEKADDEQNNESVNEECDNERP